MGAVPALAKVQMSLELLSFVLCLATVVTQLGLLDFYFVFYLKDKFWLFWIAADALVVAVMVWLLWLAVGYSKRCMSERCADDSNVRFAFLAWLTYSCVVSVKVGVMFRLFAEKIVREQQFGPSFLKIVLAGSAVVFLFLVLSHHYSQLNSPRQMYLSYLASSVTLDIIDSVLFLQMLIDPGVKDSIKNYPGLSTAILFFACLTFIMPTFALFKLRYRKGLPSWIPLPYEKLYTLAYFITVNVPFLVIRSFVWQQGSDASIFIVKNVIMVVLAFREIWISYLMWKEGKNNKISTSKNGVESSESVPNNNATCNYGGNQVCSSL